MIAYFCGIFNHKNKEHLLVAAMAKGVGAVEGKEVVIATNYFGLHALNKGVIPECRFRKFSHKKDNKLLSEAIDIVAEWRCFILYDEIIDVRPYGVMIDSNRKSHMYHYDAEVLSEMLEEFKRMEERPMACSMDICLTKDGRTLLMEFNDAYSLGCYGLAPVLYARLMSARWSQIMEREDEYKF